jgi:hypothetical protein
MHAAFMTQIEVLRMARSFYAMAGRRTFGFGLLRMRSAVLFVTTRTAAMHRSRVCGTFTFTAGIDSSLYSCDFCQRSSDGLRCLLPLDCSSGGVEVHVVFVAVQMV